MKITPYQIKLLREASKYSLMELKGRYYRLGGHGDSPLRIVRKSRMALQNMGLLKPGSTISTSTAGKAYLQTLDENATKIERTQDRFPCTDCGKPGLAAPNCICPICGGE